MDWAYSYLRLAPDAGSELREPLPAGTDGRVDAGGVDCGTALLTTGAE